MLTGVYSLQSRGNYDQCPMDGCLYTMDSEVYCFSEGGYDTMEDVCA